jgi:hypothetical protein
MSRLGLAIDGVYLDASRLQNKPSSVDAKEWTLRRHVVPAIGNLRLDRVTYAVIEDLKLQLSRKPARAAARGRAMSRGSRSRRRRSTTRSRSSGACW